MEQPLLTSVTSDDISVDLNVNHGKVVVMSLLETMLIRILDPATKRKTEGHNHCMPFIPVLLKMCHPCQISLVLVV